MPAQVYVELDRTTYRPGDTMTALVAYEVPDDSKVELSATLRFLGATLDSVPTTAVIAEVTAKDDSGRVWTLESDNGRSAIFTAKA